VPAEVEQALDARTSMNAIGDMVAYQGYQLGQAMPVAAANPAGGLAGAGVGLGMGLGIAQTMGATPTQGGSPASAQNPQPPPPLAATWHIAVNGQTQGPFTPEQIAGGIAAGQVRRDTLVWSAGMANWTAASQIPLFTAAFQPAPLPLPVTPPDSE
jgi:membrane protease subunit (stomatin/prohibitin family)